MDKIGLIDNIAYSATRIDLGRKGLITDGHEKNGRILLENGIHIAMNAFKEAQLSKNPLLVIQAEQVFLKQEFKFCDKSNITTINSLNAAIVLFDDVMRCFKIVESPILYQAVEATHPTAKKYRAKGFVLIDAFHIACNSHRTRIQNTLRTPGMNMDEKALYSQRKVNLSTAKELYMEKQRIALGLE